MAELDLSIKDAGGTTQTVALYADGSGKNHPFPMISGDDGAVILGAKSDAVWDGSAASPTWTALYKYFGTKIEAVRALLAGTLTVAAHALTAGSAIIGKVGIDQTTPGTTDSVTVATGQGAGATIGATSGAAVITDANGTLQQYLRGIVKLLITGGTIILGAGANVIGAVTQSGTWTVQPGNTANTTAWKVDGSAVTQPTKETRSSTGTQTNVASSATDVTILASNANRVGGSVYNDSTAILYLLAGSGTSSTTNYSLQLAANDYFEIPAHYTGVLKGIWASATGNARVTEFT